jgi:hypothetical protein
MQPTWGARLPAPITSHALSAAAAIIGSPAGMPVAALAAALISPNCVAGGVRSGSISRAIGTTCHFQSQLAAQRSFL